MIPCKRVGIDVTWHCNNKCRHCFYLRNPNFHKGKDAPPQQVYEKINIAHQNGLDQVVFIGQGEPSLCKNIKAYITFAHDRGMATSMITAGNTGLKRFQDYYIMGMDHLHISSHGIGDTLNDITGNDTTWDKQLELKKWLKEVQWPFRTNFTMQLNNYKTMVDTVQHEIDMGAAHIVLLGFLPHYEWQEHANTIAVHPEVLRPYIEVAAHRVLDAGLDLTIRYHPLCHLDSPLWPYVTNARHVFFDPGEWNYTLQVEDTEQLWRDSKALGDSVTTHWPCDLCQAFHHCGGYNVALASTFPDALSAQGIDKEIPPCYHSRWWDRGSLHDLNPFNLKQCILRPEVAHVQNTQNV